MCSCIPSIYLVTISNKITSDVRVYHISVLMFVDCNNLNHLLNVPLTIFEHRTLCISLDRMIATIYVIKAVNK